MNASRRRRRTSISSTAEPAASTVALSYAEKVRILLRDSLLDAAAEALTERRWSSVRMADVAAAVGVSRQTVYNEFGSKDDLARALLLRESSRFLAQVEAALDDHPQDPVGGLAAAIEVFLRLAESEPLLTGRAGWRIRARGAGFAADQPGRDRAAGDHRAAHRALPGRLAGS